MAYQLFQGQHGIFIKRLLKPHSHSSHVISAILGDFLFHFYRNYLCFFKIQILFVYPGKVVQIIKPIKNTTGAHAYAISGNNLIKCPYRPDLEFILFAKQSKFKFKDF